MIADLQSKYPNKKFEILNYWEELYKCLPSYKHLVSKPEYAIKMEEKYQTVYDGVERRMNR